MLNQPADNPFSMVYTALADLFWSYPNIESFVRPGNFVRYDQPQDRDPIKDNVLPSDVPEVILMENASTANIHNSSSGSMTQRTYSWMISTGDFRTTYSMAKVEWIIWCAMNDWSRALGPLEWPIGSGQPFCKRLQVTETTTGLSATEQNRNLKGWSAIWQVMVEMHFRTQDLRNEMQ